VKKIRLLIVALMLLPLSLPTWAVLDIQITQGELASTPIAIYRFSQESNDPSIQTQLSQVVSHDLAYSGFFNVTYPASNAQQVPAASASFDMDKWRKKDVNYVLTGHISRDGGNSYYVNFTLWDTLSAPASDGQSSTSPQASILLRQSFTAKSTGLRAVGHHISDLIYQKLIGVRGIFSTKIAYVTVQNRGTSQVSYTLNIADQDGYNEQLILRSKEPIMSPAWSPDGKKIAYVSFEGGQAAIYVQTIATGVRQLITKYPGINGAPAFSPDGSKLAVVLTRTGNPKIYVYNFSTHALTQLTYGYSIDTEPAWAPDGKSLVFTSSRGGSPQVYRYYFNTRSIDRLTFDGSYNARASFLPDGKGIVMMHRNQGLYGIAEQNLETANVAILSQSGYDESPSISPNGRMVLYASHYNGRGVLSMVSVDGKVKLRLPARIGIVQDPTWSPYLS
jgi:TolB protein